MKKRWMFPLFWRIFLAIWLAMAATVIISHLATYLLLDRERQAIERQLGLRELGEEAVDIYRQQGRGHAWRFLREEGAELDLHLMLLDQQEGDRRLPKVIRERMNGPWFRQKPAIIEFADGYRLVAWPRMHGEGWLDPRLFRIVEVFLAFSLITLACWWIARLVSRPLRHMEKTAMAIAGGDNTLRVPDRIAVRRDEVGQLATAFNAMTEQLCQMLERQQQLLRDISHDLRTPLARQRVAIELAGEGVVDDDLLASILRQNERLEAMTSQILTLYRVAEQGREIERETIRPFLLVDQVLRDVADYAEHSGVDCKLVADERSKVASVLGDASLLERCIDNIVQNALDHTPPGHGIHVTLEVSNEKLALTIEDEGPGVPAESLPHLFEPFYRGDKSRGGGGWGLGLAIARDIVQAHSGEIRAENGEFRGLRVTILLPLFIAD